MKLYWFIPLILLLYLPGCNSGQLSETSTIKTYCNPLNVSYRFCADTPSRREAADPSVVWFKDRYYLFASKSGGYWHSKDLYDWIFIQTDQIPIEEYAPTAIVLNDTIYFLASSNEKSTIYKSADPLTGNWEIAVEQLQLPVWDPMFLLDDDMRLYLYWGCSNVNPIYGVEVDYKNNFAFIGQAQVLLHQNPDDNGWEVPGDYNTLINQKPWIEGAWVNKINGKYYLQYSGPGTEFKSYSDAVYVSTNPLGPFSLQLHNPFAYKPEGFASGAGHGGSFTDRHGNYWHLGTMTISQKHIFERRLGLFPAFIDEDGTFYSITKFGDYPMTIPKSKVKSFDDVFAGWMLLSYNKKVQVSSALDSFPAVNMTDENIRTYWAANTGSAGEYAIMDLGQDYDIHAVQINFAEHNTTIMGRQKGIYHRYTVEYSSDNTNWKILVDKSENTTDQSHDYIQMEQKVNCRFVKITNIEVPGGNFALSGFRVFGKGFGNPPAIVGQFNAKRDSQDRRKVSLSWTKSSNATGYHVNFGVKKDRLYHHYIVYGDNQLTINSLNARNAYYFSIEAFNENGTGNASEAIVCE
jgi:xylan 1,4-beta-xylosidase